MKTIIAEKPSVAKEIARIVGATGREEGYLTGNGYHVTWALGHLVQPALPEGYGISGFRRDSLPVLPEEFLLVPRQVRTEKGYKADMGVMKQIRLIGRLFGESERIIVATDAGREGELIFRYLYAYLGCTVPFDRLWINSLTDSAIREGLKNLKDGKEYDNLYHVAKARSEADWLVGINGTQALSLAAGIGTYSVGRVQTPTLAMVCERYRENKAFKPVPFWQVSFGVKGTDNDILKFTSARRWTEKGPAVAVYDKLYGRRTATLRKIEGAEKVEEAPRLYDLTTLQKEANRKYGFTAEHTLEIAQKLYEAKLITYPRTSSRYIPLDVLQEIPALLEKHLEHPVFGEALGKIGRITRRSVDDAKVTDHHALLVTPLKAVNIYNDELTVYEMILGRMVEAFSPPCIRDTVAVTAECQGEVFTLKGSVLRQEGWRAVYRETGTETVVPTEWKEGDELPLSGCALSEGKTKPKPLHTESSLLAAMERPHLRKMVRPDTDESSERDVNGALQKDCDSDTFAGGIQQGMFPESSAEADSSDFSAKDCSIGTPATRAAIIETLLKRAYIVRQEKALVPTEKGLALYSILKDKDLADPEMTGRWEQALAQIESGASSYEDFMRDIRDYTRRTTTELLSCDKLFGRKDGGCRCPKCGTGTMQFYGKVVRCDNTACGLPAFRQIAGKTLTDAEVTELLTQGKTKLLKGFHSKTGKVFEASLELDADFKTKFVFKPFKKGKGTSA